jgi:hypothetical protein
MLKYTTQHYVHLSEMRVCPHASQRDARLSRVRVGGPHKKTSGAQAAPLLTHDMHSHGRASSQSTRKHECPFLFAACAFACICLCMHSLLVTSSCRLVGCISLPSPSHAPVLAAPTAFGLPQASSHMPPWASAHIGRQLMLR